jgi:hypothetical protein
MVKFCASVPPLGIMYENGHAWASTASSAKRAYGAHLVSLIMCMSMPASKNKRSLKPAFATFVELGDSYGSPCFTKEGRDGS